MTLNRHTPLRRTTPLKADPQKQAEWQQRSRQASQERARQAAKPKRRSISPASPKQREKVRHAPCVRCQHPGPCHPAHIIDRSMGGDDDPRAVVPLCAACHRLYDDGACSLLEHLEPHYRCELAYAVELVGLIAALNRVTNSRYAPERAA